MPEKEKTKTKTWRRVDYFKVDQSLVAEKMLFNKKKVDFEVVSKTVKVIGN